MVWHLRRDDMYALFIDQLDRFPGLGLKAKLDDFMYWRKAVTICDWDSVTAGTLTVIVEPDARLKGLDAVAVLGRFPADLIASFLGWLCCPRGGGRTDMFSRLR